MMMRTLVLLLALCGLASTSMRANFGKNVYKYTIATDYDSYYNYKPDDDSLRVHEIQADQYIKGNVLVAVGNAIYTVDKYGKSTLIAGHPYRAGFETGYGSSVRFNQTAGFAQLPGDELLISDKGNQCIRRLYRSSRQVFTYAGTCNSTQGYYQGSRYIKWRRFNKPTKLQYDSTSEKIYILDEVEKGRKFAILSKSRSSSYVHQFSISTSGRKVTDFIYDPVSLTYALAGPVGVTNRTSAGYSRSTEYVTDPYGLALYDDILFITRMNSGEVMFVDGKNGNNYTLCGSPRWSTYRYNLPTCTLTKPTSVAVINGYLYIGSTTTSGYQKKAVLTKIPFSTSAYKQWTTATTTSDYLYTDSNDISYSDDGDSSYSSDSGSNGYVALIVVACIAGVGLKIALITWRIRRCTNYHRRYATSTTVVAVTSTASQVPYGRLETPATPATGHFPAPPPYVPMQQPPQQQLLPQQPAYQPPPAAAAAPNGQPTTNRY